MYWHGLVYALIAQIYMKLKCVQSILAHLCGMFLVGVCMLYAFFYTALPYLTAQSKAIQVPDLLGFSINDLDQALSSRRLRYVLTDSSIYSATMPPLTVLHQFPEKDAWVKPNRKIYITLNAKAAPLVSMPNLIDGSLRQAQLLLANKGLKLGKITYVPDLAKYAVLEQWHNEQPIASGKLVKQGDCIDVVVGSGLGNQKIQAPSVLDTTLDEAELVLLEHGIQTKVVYHAVSEEQKAMVGHVLKQHPVAGTWVRTGSIMRLWVADIA